MDITVVILDEITQSPGSKVRVRSRIGYMVATLDDRTHSPGLSVNHSSVSEVDM